MSIPSIGFKEGEALLDWVGFTEALAKGHNLPKAEIGDTFLYRDPDTLLSRSAWIDGMGLAVKTATIFPGNPKAGKPMVNGAVCLYSDQDGTLDALVDFHLVTKWKTAGDSLLGAMRLANPDSRDILIVGAGTVAGSLVEAFGAAYPRAQIRVWNRTQSKAEDMKATYPQIEVAADLEAAVRSADIIVTSTMSSTPVVKGAWLKPGQHLNLIGAYRPDMRETDDEALCRARIYCDSFDTTLDHIGEFKIPLSEGVIQRGDVLADFYSLDSFPAYDPEAITLFKNGGGAHLDLMTSRHILEKWRAKG
ncbi:NAD(P)-binding domain-containing protein [Phaeobacter gallaeciensis]|jgi:ornithine cyclodeaminase|uniref:ornithine cyclodeaminase family protein n=1 Tax=Phaeobacter gallaeciensis TaxID=60890 RepID=UPI00237F7A67|nr:NAD(P)-binding domain-containing protein [Phaeobacter gallaeciensis]MDE4305431.1 NAD(P)-binding domain-containing protein [Phaeobacter gallaeciensis]MDE4309779.1 NAD(P)-binding domain-containing protein [Phaeobacter gallaeciensis]MDE4314236.1 NAD(P)-binding domain-containing protein [Phaeobacter gallaeciensis]MDE4318921.1 NAD(P)-binding domain-containing protein [Phaeobacter gallaeciensis]MDE4323083.1 NAD(P)-binding domain-containing protein [Phaeobacter gallaeciensis]